ncbi:response regulator [candidate division KSB1 bacterium]|nr:response regulator [candidate division KSB1 bacterium]
MAKQKVRVLLVEDSQSTRLMYKRVLEDAEFQVIEASKGQEGWDLALAEIPDVVLLDLILPDMHGLQVLKNIRSHVSTKEIPVLILTNVQEAEEMQRTLSFGASRYVNKGNITPEKLVDLVNELLMIK